MAIPLKTGADLYNNELLRARLHNHPADKLDEHGVGSIYFNNSSELNSSNRIRYRGLTNWHSVANLEDIEDVKDLIKALSGSSSESVASVLGRVITLEGYFSNGKAKDADLLDGHNSDYFATATTVNDLLEDYEAFKAVFSDNSDEYINTWTEVKAFLDGIKNTEDLNAILLGINTELGKKADKATTLAGYGITDALTINNNIDIANGKPYNVAGYGYSEYGWQSSGPALSFGTASGYLMQLQSSNANGHLYHKHVSANWEGDWHLLIDDHNYSDLITDLNNNLNVKGGILADYEVGISRSTLVGQLLGGNEDYTYVGRTKSGVWEKDIFKFYANDDNYAYGNFIFEKQINSANGIKIGNAILSWDEEAQSLKISTNVYADGQVSSGGSGSEGSGSGASGIVILEDWEKYDDTLAQVLGAGLGVGLRDRVAALESKATNVSVAQTLTSGKEIGAITIDGVATKLFAPDDYLPLSGGTLNGSLGMTSAEIPDGAVGLWGTGSLYLKASDKVSFYNSSTGAFNEILHEGNYASVLDSAYLKLSGGTLSGTLDMTRESGAKSHKIKFSDWHWEGFLYQETGELRWGHYEDDTTKNHTILHAGNFKSYAPTLTGTGASGTWGIDITGAATALKPTLARPSTANVEPIGDGSVRSFLVTTSMTEGRPHDNAAGTILSFYWDSVAKYTRQLFIGAEDAIDSPNKRLAWRTQDGHRWSDWKTLAFTDSNVASATKLATARTIWGQSFDGTADVIGNLKLKNEVAIEAALKNGLSTSILHMSSGNNLVVGYGSSGLGVSTYIDGNSVGLCYGTNRTLGFALNDSGNVTIGSSDLAGTNYKLYVDGDILLPNYKRLLSLDTSGNARNLVHLDSTNKVYFGDIGCESVLRGAKLKIVTPTNSSGVVINYTGNVTIGADDKAGESQHFNVQNVFAVSSSFSKAAILNIVETNANTNYIHMFVGSNTTITNRPLVLQYGYGHVGIGVIEPQYKLDIAGSIRASNFGIFGSRLLVGAVTDDGTTALQVKGASKLDGILTLPINHQIQWGNSGSMIYASATAMDLIAPIAYFSKDVHVRGNLIVDGQVSAGGVAEAGTGGATGGSGLDRVVFTIPAQTTSFTCEHNLGTREISVTIYEEGNDYQQVLTDVYLDSTNIARVVFGSATDVAHKVVIIG